MGFFLVFFPEDTTATDTSATILDKPISTSKSIKRTTTSNNPIITKTQSTISICAFLIFLTLILFTLSTFEPTIPNPTLRNPRRFLSEKPPNKVKPQTGIETNFWFIKAQPTKVTKTSQDEFALQRMGKLYRRGTRAMSDLVVGHVAEDTNEDEFRLFLRLLHRSGLSARADLVFTFNSSSFASRFEGVIREENDSFLKLINRYKEMNRMGHDLVSAGVPSLDLTRFMRSSKKEMGEPLWGKRIRINNNYNDSDVIVSTQLSYGSVVGFESSELDPENSLAGFLDHVPMSLRRWACYPMLLGRVKRNFKHVMLVDVKNVLLVGDPLGRVRNRSPESVHMYTKQQSTSTKSSKRNSEKSQQHNQVNLGILMGGGRGIRRLSNAMLMEIVRVAMQHKKKSPVTESTILTQLVGNGHLLKNINVITSTEPIPETSSLVSFKSGLENFCSIFQHGNTNREFINSIIIEQICSRELESSVYRDCL